MGVIVRYVVWRRDRHLVAVCKEFHFIANAITIILAVRQVGLFRFRRHTVNYSAESECSVGKS